MTTNSWGFVLIGLAVGIAATATAYWVTDLPKILPLAVGLVLVGALLARRKSAVPGA